MAKRGLGKTGERRSSRPDTPNASSSTAEPVERPISHFAPRHPEADEHELRELLASNDDAHAHAEHEARLATDFFSVPPPPPTYDPADEEHAPAHAPAAPRAMWLTVGMLATSVALIGGFMAYHQLVMPQPAELGSDEPVALIEGPPPALLPYEPEPAAPASDSTATAAPEGASPAQVEALAAETTPPAAADAPSHAAAAAPAAPGPDLPAAAQPAAAVAPRGEAPATPPGAPAAPSAQSSTAPPSVTAASNGAAADLQPAAAAVPSGPAPEQLPAAAGPGGTAPALPPKAAPGDAAPDPQLIAAAAPSGDAPAPQSTASAAPSNTAPAPQPTGAGVPSGAAPTVAAPPTAAPGALARPAASSEAPASVTAVPVASPELSFEQLLAQAESLSQRGQSAQAVAAFERALQRQPGAPAALAGKAYAHLNLNDREAAKSLAEQAVAADPTSSRGWIVLGAVEDQLGARGAAQAAYRRCAEQGVGRYVSECKKLVR